MKLTGIEKAVGIAVVFILALVVAAVVVTGKTGISPQKVEDVRQKLAGPTSMYVHDYEGALPPNAAALYPYHKSDVLAKDIEKLEKAGYRIEFSKADGADGLLPEVSVTIQKPQ